MQLTEPLFEVFGHALSGKHLILLAGGLFLVGKATLEPTARTRATERDVRARSIALEAGERSRYVFERVVSGAEAIRDVIAFPKTQRAQCLLTGAPSLVDENQLRELHIRLRNPTPAA